MADLTDQELRGLDYAVNYWNEKNFTHTLGDEVVNSLETKEFVKEIEDEDKYSNTYKHLKINEEKKDEVRQLVEDFVERKYNEGDEQTLENLFNESPHDMFEAYANIKATSQIDLRWWDIASSSYDDIDNIIEMLENNGYGYLQYSVLTNGNKVKSFVFREFPFDGIEVFLKTSKSVFEKNLQSLNKSEIWASYVDKYIGREYILDNIANYSRKNIESALEKPEVQGDRNLAFIREEVKSKLRKELDEAIKKDTSYLTVLEFLKAISTERTRNSRKVNRHPIRNIPSERKPEINSSIQQLQHWGLLLKEGEEIVLTKELQELISGIEDRAKIESYAIESVESAQNYLYDIFSEVEQEVKIIDRYFDDDALEIVNSNIRSDIRVMVLLGNKTSANQLNKKLSGRVYDSSQYEIRQLKNNNDFPHDRFIIVDNKRVWQVGHSLNGLGKDFATIFSHSESEARRYIDLFDNLWRSANNI